MSGVLSQRSIVIPTALCALAFAALPTATAAQEPGWHGTMSGRLQVEETSTGVGSVGTPYTRRFNWTAQGTATLTQPVPGGVHGSGTGSSNATETVTYSGPTNCFGNLGGTFAGSGPLEFDPVVVSVGFVNGHWRIGAEAKSVPSTHTSFGGCGTSTTQTNDTVWGTVVPLEIPGSPTDEEIHGTFDAP